MRRAQVLPLCSGRGSFHVTRHGSPLLASLQVRFDLQAGAWREKGKRRELFQHWVPDGSLTHQLQVLG